MKRRKLNIREIKIKIKMRYLQNVKCKLNVICSRFTAEKIVLAYVRIQHKEFYFLKLLFMQVIVHDVYRYCGPLKHLTRNS